ncbi:hypothetical protein G9A89_006026 [Geosiphon pyriformis]|nr:hypothetical protein G9A89_006026 [Geosiphon pyriformis]
MNGSLRDLGSVDIKAGTVVFFENISLDLEVRVFGLMSSTLAKLQAIILAFECVPPNSSPTDKIPVEKLTFTAKNNTATTKFKVVTTPDATTLEYYQLIYIHCKQRFNIPDGIEVVKKLVYQYIENCINNYLFGNYNISEVRSNLYNNLAHYSQLETEDLNSETLATYFHKLNFNIIKYCKETYPVQSQYSIDFESETETSNKGKNKLKQYSKTTPNTPTLPKTTAKHLQTPEQRTSLKLPLTITLFPASLAQAQMPNSPLNRFARPKDFTSLKTENQSEHSKTAANEKNEPEISEEKSIDSENKEDEMTTYIAKIPEFNGEDIETSPQEWLDQVTKAGDANGWNAARIYKMAMEEANCTKLVNLAIGETSSAAKEKIDQLTKKIALHNKTLPILPPARIAENANLSDIFPFEFEANELPFLLSNAAANKQKAIMAMYTETEVEGKTIRLILNIIVTADGMKKTPVGEIDNFPFTLNGIIISVKVFVIDAPQYQALNNMPEYLPLMVHSINALKKPRLLNSNRKRKNPSLKHSWLLNQCPTGLMKQNKNILPHTVNPKPLDEIYLTQNLNQENNAPIFPLNVRTATRNYHQWGPAFYLNKNMKIILGHLIKRSGKWDNTPCLTSIRGGVCNQICQYALSISEKVKGGTPFDAVYNSAFNKLYHYPYDAEMIFDLAMALINGATQETVCQIKKSEYIAYTFEIAGYNYEDEVKVYYQIASHTYLTKEAQIQQLEQMNIRLCEKCIVFCDEQWCPECYVLSIPLLSENDKNKIEFGEPKAIEEIETTPIYLIKNQPALQLKYFNNNGQEIKPKKAYKINAGYDLRYPDKNTFVFKPKSFTKINLKIALEIPPGAIVQIASQSSLASKRINVRRGIIDAGYMEDITVMLQNETDKPFKIDHDEKIAQAIYLLLINIVGLQLNKSHQIFRLLQPIIISPFREHPEIYTCPKPTTTQQIFESNKQKEQRNNIFQQKLPQTVPNFSEIIGHSLPKINPNPSSENYHVVMEKLSRINIGQLEPQQQTQLKELIAEFANIFAENKNDLE